MASPDTILAACKRLVSSCRCNWSEEDRNAVINYLAPLLPQQPDDIPLWLMKKGTTWWIERR